MPERITRPRPPDRRLSAARRGYGVAWRKSRADFLRDHPLCVECEAEGMLTPATDVDHIVPHRGDPAKFWDRKNWQSLCERHHSAKTAKEGGFGRVYKYIAPD
ncbi:MAG TPA: HNH endonuclease [Gemmataceae bacterium]|nr:HNH endonuclease [Gemmataceae bacterium]